MRQYLAAVAGLFAAVGFASAQAPVAPKFTPAGNFANPADAAMIQQASAFGGAAGDNCASTASTLRSRYAIGAGTVMPIGCSCLAAEKTFFFGSCAQFFNPQNYCSGAYYGGGCGFGGAGIGGCNSCGGGGREKHPCQGVTSYLNR